MLSNYTSSWVETLAVTERIDFDVISDGEPGRERVTELNNAEGGANGDEAEEIWNGGRDNESNTPVNGYNNGPEDLSRFGGERRGMQKVHEDIVV